MKSKSGTFEHIESRIRESADRNQFGKDFEWLCKYYLENHPIYRSLLRKVWLWEDWPDRWGRDAGIDIIAETKNGRMWAIQCKAVGPEYSIKKSEIDSFLSESNRPEIDYRLLIGTTNNIGSNAHQTLKGQEKGVGLILRSDLLRDDIIWPDTIGDSPKQIQHLPVEPRTHQVAAISDVIAGFRTNDRGQLIMACGTGKTLTGLWIAEQLAARRILVLVPTLSLVSQTIREWSANAKTPFEYCAVCSDETVVSDEAISSISDLGIPVTTSPEMISQFLDNTVGRGIVFCTYHSSHRIAEALSLTKERFDLSISDEAHRCTGKIASSFGTILDSDKIRCNKRLFMTATPRIFKEHIKKKAGEVDIEIASMDEIEQFGPVFHRLDFSRSIKLGLLSDYQVIVIGVTDRETKKFVKEGTFVRTDDGITTDARTLAAQIGLSKAMKKYDLSKIITFHSSIAKASRFSSDKPDSFQGVVDWLPKSAKPSGNLWIRHISGKMPTSQRTSLLNELKTMDDRGLITNCRCLSEGVDVPALDGISFVDPKTSQIDIIQAVGRVMRKSPGKEKGTIVVPVFVNETEDTDTALRESSYDTVYAVIRALRSHDDLLAIELDNLRTNLGSRLKLTTDKIREKITLDLPTLVLKDFESAFYVKSIERSSLQWQAMIGQLKQYKKKYGDVNVPKKVDEPWTKLGHWVYKTRFKKRWERPLSQDLIGQLDSLGFDWKFEGETLDSVEGLVVEKELIVHLFGGMKSYRKKGIVKPYGWRRSSGGLSAYYHPDQIPEIKQAVIRHYRPDDPEGKWIEDTEGLLSEYKVSQFPGFSQIGKHRKNGWIKPVGYATQKDKSAGSGLVSFYHPEQIEEHKRFLIDHFYGDPDGKIVENPESKGYIGEWDIRLMGTNTVESKRLASGSKKIKYDPKIGTTRLDTYRRNGLIKPDCYGLTGTGYGPYYKPESIIKFKENLFKEFLNGREGKLLYDTEGLITEKKFREKAGFTNLARFRKRGLIEPHGYAYGHTAGKHPFVAYYRLEQQQEFYEQYGIDIIDHTGYLTEAGIREEYGLKSIHTYRKKGWIVPKGKGIVGGAPIGSYLYLPDQIPELKKTIMKELFNDSEGNWLDDTKGLMREKKVRMDYYPAIAKYKKEGLIKPTGYGWSDVGGGIVPYYHPKQFKDLEKKLGVTITDTTGLVPQKKVTDDFGITHSQIKYHREKGNLKPLGKGWFWTKKTTRGLNKRLVNYYKKEDIIGLSERIREQNTKWEDFIRKLKHFKKENGHCRVPRNNKKYKVLAFDCKYYRSRKVQGLLDEGKIQTLDKIGFSWSPNAERWDENYSELLEFQKKYGHVNVPQTKKHWKLAKWVGTQRTDYKSKQLSVEHITKLDDIGFVWDINYSLWSTNIDTLKKFKSEFGHVNVPITWEDKSLGKWVSHLREDKKNDKLDPVQIEELENLGIIWNPFEHRWNEKYKLLREYWTINKNCNVTKTDDKVLHIWVMNTRQQNRRGKLSEERITKLNKINFDW